MKADADWVDYLLVSFTVVAFSYAGFACWSVAGDPFNYNRPPELQAYCVAYVDTEGYLRGRNVLFTEEKFKKYKGDLFIFSHEGPCTNEGPPRRVVCPEGDEAMWEDQCMKKTWNKTKL